MLFTAQARWLADKHSKVADSRWYYFSYVPEGNRADQPHGVPHGGEMIFPFGGRKDRFTAADRAMSEKVSSYWFSFAKTGTPAGQPAWPKHETGGVLTRDKTLMLGEEIEVAHDFRKVRLDALIAQYPMLEAALAAGSGSGSGPR